MKFRLHVQLGKRGERLKRPPGIDGDLAVDKGEAHFFDAVNEELLLTMKEAHLVWFQRDGFLLRGLESRGFNRQHQERFTYQEWFCTFLGDVSCQSTSRG